MDFVDVSETNSLYSFSTLEHDELAKNNNAEPRRHKAQKPSLEPNNKLPPKIYVPSKSECKVKSFDPLNRARQNWQTVDVVHYKITADNGYIYIGQIYRECYFFAHLDEDNNLLCFSFGSLADLDHVLARAEASNASVSKWQTKNYYINVTSGTLWCCSWLGGLAYSVFVDMCGNIIFPFGAVKVVEMVEQMRRCDTFAWSIMNISPSVKGSKPIIDKQKYIIQAKNLYHAPDELSAGQAWKIINYYYK